MAALPVNNTPRFKFHYTIGQFQHTAEVRTQYSPATVGSFMNRMWGFLGTFVYTTTLDNVEFSATGSNVFNPVTTGFEGSVYGSGAIGLGSAPNYVNFIGRSVGGRRVRLMIFGIKGLGENFRFSPGEQAEIDACIAELHLNTPSILAIDGLGAIWKSYANAGVNSHWQKAVR